MMTFYEIPDKVVRKALHAYISHDCDTPEEAMRRAIVVALTVWPGAEERTSGIHPNGIGGPGEEISRRLILPLTPEGGEG